MIDANYSFHPLLKNKHILIIGKNSFLGNNLAQNLANNQEIQIWNTKRCANKGCNHQLPFEICVDKDGSFKTEMKIPEFEACFILSTYYSRELIHIPEIIQCNIIFLSNIVEQLKNHTKKIIYTNTYINLLDNPKSIYGISKKWFAIFLKEFCGRNQIKFIELFVFDVWGANDPRKKIINILCGNKKNQTFKFSEGDQLLAPISISDAIDNLIFLINYQNKNEHEQFSLKGPDWVTLRDVVKLINNLKKVEIDCEFGSIPYNGDEMFAAIETLKNPLQNKQRVSVEQLIGSIIEVEGKNLI